MVERSVVTDSDAELAAGRLGRVVGGRWRLESVLGVGGMAAVYGGRDASGAVAAIKILHPEMSVRREVRERFLREGYVANRIGHPGVVQALEHGETGDEVFLAMELLAGETLRVLASNATDGFRSARSSTTPTRSSTCSPSRTTRASFIAT